MLQCVGPILEESKLSQDWDLFQVEAILCCVDSVASFHSIPSQGNPSCCVDTTVD